MCLDFVLHQAASGYIWRSQYDRQKVYTKFLLFAVDLLFLLLVLYVAAEHAVATVVKAILSTRATHRTLCTAVKCFPLMHLSSNEVPSFLQGFLGSGEQLRFLMPYTPSGMTCTAFSPFCLSYPHKTGELPPQDR